MLLFSRIPDIRQIQYPVQPYLLFYHNFLPSFPDNLLELDLAGDGALEQDRESGPGTRGRHVQNVLNAFSLSSLYCSNFSICTAEASTNTFSLSKRLRLCRSRDFVVLSDKVNGSFVKSRH